MDEEDLSEYCDQIETRGYGKVEIVTATHLKASTNDLLVKS